MNLILAVAVAAASAPPPICTDRPAKANAVCTVSVGNVQIESGLAGWSLTKGRGTRTTVLTVAPMTTKLGLTSRSDIQVSWALFTRLRVRGGGSTTGVGDVTVRYKQRLTDDQAPMKVAIIPFIKIPTAARGIGNDKVEGGLAAPVSFGLRGPITMTLGPEVDLLADADGSGRHLALVNLVNVAGPIAPRLTLAGELWSNFNLDPAGTVRQASADAALAYAVSTEVQFDAGANIGFTRDTADVEIYAGLSIRL